MNGQDTARALPAVAFSEPAERLTALFDVHYARLYRLARRLAPSTDDALDLVQETFLRAAKFPKSVPVGPTNEEAWLVRVLVNIRRDQWRKRSVCERHNKAAFAGSRLASGGDPEEVLITRAAVWQALDVLPPRRRAIIVMHELEGLAIPAIASLLDINAVTVRWHLSKGRRELTGALKAYLGDPNEKD
jgi:RNA polymerase sigma-70 factor (ECF subfamily)